MAQQLPKIPILIIILRQMFDKLALMVKLMEMMLRLIKEILIMAQMEMVEIEEMEVELEGDKKKRRLKDDYYK